MNLPLLTNAQSSDYAHYAADNAPIEAEGVTECAATIRNIGWTLGNDCPFRCTHCYSMNARVKGQNMSPWMIDRIVAQLAECAVETVNLGGNEPLFTNGLNPRDTLLPYIVSSLTDRGILVGLTTAGPTLTYLSDHHPETVSRLNDIDISFDSPYEHEHNRNRGANLFSLATRCLEIASKYEIDRTIILCAMSWNFSIAHLRDLVALAATHDANVRINPLKPVTKEHLASELTPDQYYTGFKYLMELCNTIELGEPPLKAVCDSHGAGGCPCGRTSFRIHSITPDGKIPVSPCVYLHDYKAGDLLKDDLKDILASRQFRTFRRRWQHPAMVDGCDGCEMLLTCRGGCAARSYLANLHNTQRQTMFARDPYCPRDFKDMPPFPVGGITHTGKRLVHQDYLCTWIGKPKT